MKVLPVARTESLIIKEVEDETLVYDLTTDQAHCLNDTAARVWKHCDGRKSVSEITEMLRTESGIDVNDEVVWLALDQLGKFNLLDNGVEQPATVSGMSRRQMVRLAGVAAFSLPLITSIVAPTPALAASCRACQQNTECAPSEECDNNCCKPCQNPPCSH